MINNSASGTHRALTQFLGDLVLELQYKSLHLALTRTLLLAISNASAPPFWAIWAFSRTWQDPHCTTTALFFMPSGGISEGWHSGVPVRFIKLREVWKEEMFLIRQIPHFIQEHSVMKHRGRFSTMSPSHTLKYSYYSHSIFYYE